MYHHALQRVGNQDTTNASDTWADLPSQTASYLWYGTVMVTVLDYSGDGAD